MTEDPALSCNTLGRHLSTMCWHMICKSRLEMSPPQNMSDWKLMRSIGNNNLFVVALFFLFSVVLWVVFMIIVMMVVIIAFAGFGNAVHYNANYI